MLRKGKKIDFYLSIHPLSHPVTIKENDNTNYLWWNNCTHFDDWNNIMSQLTSIPSQLQLWSALIFTLVQNVMSELVLVKFLCFVSELNTWVSFSWWNAKIWAASVPDHQPRSEVYYHVKHSFSRGGGWVVVQTVYMHPSVILNASPSLLSVSVSPEFWAHRHSAMMGFSDGIKMSRPTAVTHANCIVYRFYHREQPAICFLWCLPSFHFYFVLMSLSWHFCFSR